MVAAYAWVAAQLDWPTAQVAHSWIDSHGITHNRPTALLLPEAPVTLALTLVPFVALCVMVGMRFSYQVS